MLIFKNKFNQYMMNGDDRPLRGTRAFRSRK